MGRTSLLTSDAKMESKNRKKRLDEILLQKGKVSDAQIAIALNRQKTFGGKLGSHILHHGFVDEATLVDALSEHFGCGGVQLSNLEIPESIIKMIPASFAFARRVVPFDFDPQKSVLKVACVDPTDKDLLNEIGYVVSGKAVELYVAVEIALNFAISRYYDNRKQSGNALSATVTETTSEPTQPTFAQHTAEKKGIGIAEKPVLLVLRDENSSYVLRLLLEKDGYKVVQADSADNAIDEIAHTSFHTIFIQEGVAGNRIDLMNRLRILSPQTRVRPFKSFAGLLINEDTAHQANNLLQQNLELFTSLLTIKDRAPSNHSARVGHYVDRLCRYLNLPEKDRMIVINAAYLHDRAKFYYVSASPRDFRTLVKLATKLLQSVYYQPTVVEILRAMYIDLTRKHRDQVPIEVVGGNILTIVDIFCNKISPNERLTLEKRDAIKNALNGMVGQLLLPEVFESFVRMIQEEELNAPMFAPRGQIMIYSDEPERTFPLDGRLKNEGFRTINAGSSASCIQLFERCRPDMLIMHLHSGPRDIIAVVNDLTDSGVDFKSTPTFLLVKNSTISHLTSLLEQGIEDIMNHDANLDLVALKIKKSWAQVETRAKQPDEVRERLGSKGNLSDMNLIDLLQALGPSRRTTKITVTPSARANETLEIHLDQGNVIFARLNDLQGAEAIYIGLTWDQGSWSIEQISEKDLHEPNNQLSNEMILMEGCRVIDELTSKLYQC